MWKIYVYGSDKRQEMLRKLYEKNIINNVEEAKYILLPIPLTKDGVHITGEEIEIQSLIPTLKHKTVFAGKIPKNIARLFEINNITYYDLMEDEALAIKNAIPTAEGTIQKIMELTDTTVYNSNVLVLGFGKCGSILADRLYGLKANVFCAARKEKNIAQIKALGYNEVDILNMDKILPEMDVIVNTVPYMILNERMLKLVRKDAVIIDIASAPGGTDFEYCSKNNIKAYLELAIPSKVASISASIYVKEAIERIIRGDNL